MFSYMINLYQYIYEQMLLYKIIQMGEMVEGMNKKLKKQINGDVAHQVEHMTENHGVVGSSPTVPTKQMPTWTNWQSRFSQKEEFSRFDSECGYQV